MVTKKSTPTKVLYNKELITPYTPAKTLCLSSRGTKSIIANILKMLNVTTNILFNSLIRHHHPSSSSLKQT